MVASIRLLGVQSLITETTNASGNPRTLVEIPNN
jgi:hypothetical protein